MKTIDKRRYRLISVVRRNSNTYHLLIDGTLWSEVEWSAKRLRWCIQDAAGQCLAHEEHVVGMDKDPQAAIRLAKRMIVNGTMPTPEEARARLKLEQERKRLGEPLPAFPQRQRQAVLVKPSRAMTRTSLHKSACFCAATI
jgi:hypothetical protein